MSDQSVSRIKNIIDKRASLVEVLKRQQETLQHLNVAIEKNSSYGVLVTANSYTCKVSVDVLEGLKKIITDDIVIHEEALAAIDLKLSAIEALMTSPVVAS
jgi:hypothetical protein